jgi:hypothetical protein
MTAIVNIIRFALLALAAYSAYMAVWCAIYLD